MTVDKSAISWEPSERLVIIVGNYGSGKTEVSVNLALRLAAGGKKVIIADLDIVNPYFRSREAGALMEANGIEVVIPPGEQQYADLPIVVPRIKTMLGPTDEDFSIFDVGGDDVGAKMLSSFHQALAGRPYSLLQVINSRRPFTDTVEGCVKMMRMIEEASRLKVSGLIVNSHLVDQTTVDIIVEGYELAAKVSEASGVPVEFVAAMGTLAKAPEILALGAPVFAIERNMLPPWLRTGKKQDNSEEQPGNVPAARTKPIFRP